MKTTKFTYIIALSCTLMMSSCNYLDYDESIGYEKESIFKYHQRTKDALTNVYTYLPSDFGSFDGSMRDAATDDGQYIWNTANIHTFTNGSWSAINTVDDVWSHFYTGIRAANTFLENANNEFPDIQWNTNYQQLMDQYKYYKYEARFLRAFFHFELAKRYKNIPLITNTIELDDINSISPQTFENVVEYIVSECDDIVSHLPVSYSGIPEAETGRITQGAVLALKSRILLYDASPLHNPSNDSQKWLRAANSAKDLIDKATAGNWYSLVNEQTVNNLNSKELILERRQANSNGFEAANFPIGYEGGKSGMNPTQNLVDAFEMTDGTPFDWNNPDHVTNIYNTSRRDARLFKTIIVNGSTWKNRPIETFIGGLNGAPINGASSTSYYLKKYLVESVSLDPNNTTTAPHNWVLFRYAEILLNYAEALYEATGDANYTGNGFTLSPVAAVNKVRNRAGMPNMVIRNFRNQLRNERRVEFAFEDQRFWDIRRWKIGDQTRQIYGVRIEKQNNNLTYSKVLINTRVWDDKMYLYPISNTEIFKNSNLEQNPGWQ
jgi:hypothetical protein